MTHQEVLNTIRAERDSAGSLRELARRWKVSVAYLSDILLGRRLPGPKVLKRMGLVGSVRKIRIFTARQSKEQVTALVAAKAAEGSVKG